MSSFNTKEKKQLVTYLKFIFKNPRVKIVVLA
jgi:hypothetical protein